MIKPNCNNCISENCFINKYVDSEWKKKINQNRLTQGIKKGEIIFREGDPVTGIYFIFKGKVKVYNSGIRNKTQIVRFADSGNILGHRGFGKSRVYPIGAAALENSTLCFVSTDIFLNTMNHNSALAVELVNFYADELRRAENKLRSLSQMTVKQKIAEAILTLSEIYGVVKENDTEFIKVQLSRQEYADITGASLEEVIRTISQLRKEQFISIEGKKIGIIHRDKLEEMLSEFGPLRLP